MIPFAVAPTSVVPYWRDPDTAVHSRFIVVDGIRTHFLEAGAGPTLVLLHAGDYGSCAEMGWEFNIAALSQRYRVVAPDWLGYGQTDKLYDFEGGQRRRLAHMTRVIEALDIDQAAFMGNSMGGTLLAGVAASPQPIWPIAALVLASAGGFAPDNEARRNTLDFDCTAAGMKTVLRTVLHDPRWAEDDEYVGRRLKFATSPGAYEAVAAARFKSPLVPARSEFGRPDATAYEQIAVPTLLMAGADDRLREPNYLDALAARIPDNQAIVFDECGHMPQIEKAKEFNEAVLDFLAAVYPPVQELT